MNIEYDSKIENNLNKLKINSEKIEKDFKNQNNINSNHEKSIVDLKKKIDNNKLIIHNFNNKNDNKNKIIIENKKIEKYELTNGKPKINRMSQWYNQISLKDMTYEFDENKTIVKIEMKKKKIKLFMKYLLYLKNGILKDILKIHLKE